MYCNRLIAEVDMKIQVSSMKPTLQKFAKTENTAHWFRRLVNNLSSWWNKNKCFSEKGKQNNKTKKTPNQNKRVLLSLNF